MLSALEQALASANRANAEIEAGHDQHALDAVIDAVRILAERLVERERDVQQRLSQAADAAELRP